MGVYLISVLGYNSQMHNEQIALILEERFKISADEAAEIVGWIRGVNQLENELYNYIFMWYCTKELMPYDVARAKTQDPTEWIYNKLTEEFPDEPQSAS